MPFPSKSHPQSVNEFSYEVPHIIHDCLVYPRSSANGSTVIVYGHETGLRVVWYAGRNYKAPVPSAPKINGNKTDSTVIDLDDDDDSESTPPKHPGFEAEYEEVDPSAPFYQVLRHLDIPLGSAALTIAAPHLPYELPEESPSILEDNIIVAAGCADFVVRTIAIPLQPPARDVIDCFKLGVQIVKHLGHQDLVTSVAVTYTANGDIENEDEETEDAAAPKWSLLVGSTSCTGSGLLLVHQLPIGSGKVSSMDQRLLRRTIVRAPLMAARLAFNTAPPAAERHTNLLLTIPDAQCVKVYQVFPHRSVRRRGSLATTDSASSSRSWNAMGGSGKFVVTMLPDFVTRHTPSQLRRKRVLDAKWVSFGRAIIALLEGGDYGIWDLEAAGPATDNTIRNQTNVTGVVGGAISRFSAHGTLDQRSKAGKSHKEAQVNETKFRRGNIDVRPSSVRNDEAVILNYGDADSYVDSLSAWWKAKSTGKGSLQQTEKPISLPVLSTGGGAATDIHLLPSFPRQLERTSFDSASVPNFVTTTSTKLILHVCPIQATEFVDVVDRGTQTRLEPGEQSLMLQGDLDLDGVDRHLETMQHSRPQSQLRTRARPNFGSSMISHDGEMDVDSPMPTKVSRLSLPQSTSTNPSRRVFS